MAQFEFAGYALDTDERRLTRDGAEVKLRGKVFDTLCVFVQSPGKLLRKEELLSKIWPDSIVEENNLDYCVSQLRKTLGPEIAKAIETVPRQGYRFNCVVKTVGAAENSPGGNAASEPAPEPPVQEIHSFQTSEGVNIAYSKCGSGPPLVKAANWLNHLEFEWKSPLWRHWVFELTKHHTFYRYDERGNGLSDWNILDFSFEAWLRDFDQLIDTLQLKKFNLLGISQGGAVSVSYASRHPERVNKMVLMGAFARGWMLRDTPGEVERRNALLTLVRLGWGKNNPAFRQLWTTLFMPEATPEQAEWFNELQRVTTSPENAVQLLAAGGRINVVDVLPKVQCPTLVLHCTDDAAVPIKEGKLVASRIPGAKFIELPSRNHMVMQHEPAWKLFLEALGDFLEWDRKKTESAAQSLVKKRGAGRGPATPMVG